MMSRLVISVGLAAGAAAGSQPAMALQEISTGSGFAITSVGQIVTNNHVVVIPTKNGDVACPALGVEGEIYNGPARIIGRDPTMDLAVIQLEKPPQSGTDRSQSANNLSTGQSAGSKGGEVGIGDLLASGTPTAPPASGARPAGTGAPVATIRTSPPQQGESVTLVGFPFLNYDPSKPIVTNGLINSTIGKNNATNLIQVSAQAHHGNSGGPLFDQAGSVIGILEQGTSEIEYLKKSGALPQNVNFAIKSTVLVEFLTSYGINFQSGRSTPRLETTEIANRAKGYTVRIHCMG
jgi:S1-C subfamily serine protease